MNKNKFSFLSSVYFASGVMFAAAVIVFIVAALTNRGDMTSAVLVLCGFMLLVTGIFILITAERPPMPAFLTELLPVQGSVNLARTLADLGVTSNTLHRFIEETGEVMQINPVTGGKIPDLSTDTTFSVVGDWHGVSYPAAAMPLLRRLKSVDHLAVPQNNFDMLSTCLSEVYADYLAIAKKVTVTKNDRSVIVVLDGFAPVNLCRAMQTESPKCCTMTGCPVCSLAASIIAESERADVLSDSVDLDGHTLTLVFSLFPHASLEAHDE